MKKMGSRKREKEIDERKRNDSSLDYGVGGNLSEKLKLFLSSPHPNYRMFGGAKKKAGKWKST